MSRPGPDFIIIGAMKSGTTTLSDQLGAQPGLFMTDPKEPNYFSDDAMYAQGSEWYRGRFAGAGAQDLTGEASTQYTKLPTHPETVARMARDIPAPRLVYMIRNPLVRVVSHYMHGWSRKEINCGLPEALETHPELISYGCYGMQIAPFTETFGAEAIYLTSLEQWKADPQAELARVCAHIGYDPDPQWREDLGARNVSAERARPLPGQKLLIDNPVAQALRRTLVPKGLRAWVRKSRTLTTRPELTEAQVAQLSTVFLQDRDRLAALFPGNPALDAAYPFAPR